MLALVHRDGAALLQVPEPPCQSDEAIVAVRLAGICATDLEVLRGYRDYRGVLGHEMVGQVVRCDADRAWEGRRVVAEINATCGACPACLRNEASHCERRTVMGIAGRDGCFAERVAVPIRCLHAVPDHIDDKAAAFVEPLAAAYEITTQIDVTEGRSVAVVGDGKLGLLVAMALNEHGGVVTAIGRHAHKLALVESLGIETALATDQDRRQFDVVVEATGSPSGLRAALQSVRPRGIVVLKSTFADVPTVDTNRIVVDEITVVGSRCGPFTTALQALAEGVVDPRPLIEAVYPLHDGCAALEHAARRGTLKILLDVGAGQPT